MYYANLERYLNLKQQNDNYVPSVNVSFKNGENEDTSNVSNVDMQLPNNTDYRMHTKDNAY